MRNSNIKISIRLFAMLRESVGQSRIQLEISEGSSIIEALNHLVDQYSQLRNHIFNNNILSQKLVLAVNGENAISLDYKLENNDELAIVPPTGGG